jgi:hypothetical protein
MYSIRTDKTMIITTESLACTLQRIHPCPTIGKTGDIDVCSPELLELSLMNSNLEKYEATSK